MEPLLAAGTAFFSVHHHEALPPLTGADIQEVVDNMNPDKALGTDSWTIPELRLLSPQLLESLAEFYTRAEAEGRWPSVLTSTIVALIPKGGAQTEAELRPIGLAPHHLQGVDVCRETPYTLLATTLWGENPVTHRSCVEHPC